MDFQDAIREIEERGDFNRYTKLKPFFEERLNTLKSEDYTERGLCNYYLLVAYLKANLVHETGESITYYERMDEAFLAQADLYLKNPKDVFWSDVNDFFKLMERCYESLEFLYLKHSFKERRLAAYTRKMNFRKSTYFFRREYADYFTYLFFDISSKYGTSLAKFFGATLAVMLFYAFAYFLADQFTENSLRLIPAGSNLFDYLYFSVVTFTTVGFGDLAPVSLISKILSMTEAFLGLFMLGIFVNLVQRRF